MDMCLGPEFFDAREALILAREAAGDLELEHFLEERGLTVDRLYEVGLLRDDWTAPTTADFFMHTITARGRRFLVKAEYQLIFVKRSHREAFGSFL